MAGSGLPTTETSNSDSGTGKATTGVSGGGATAYNDQGLATGRAAQAAAGGQGGQSKSEEVKNKVTEQGEKQKQ